MNPFLMVVLAALIWGSSGAFVKLLALPAISVTFFRVSVPTVVMFAYLFFKKARLVKEHFKLMLGISFLNVFVFVSYYYAFNSTSISNAVIMLYTWPIFTAIFSALMLGEKIPRRNVLLLICAFAGIILIYSDQQLSLSNRDFAGLSAMMASAAIWALIMVLLKKIADYYTHWEMVFYHNLMSFIVYLPLFLMTRPFPTATQVALGLTFSTLIGLVAFVLFYSALHKIKATTASQISYLEVVSALIIALVFFSETLTVNMLAGAALIIGATFALISGVRRYKDSEVIYSS